MRIGRLIALDLVALAAAVALCGSRPALAAGLTVVVHPQAQARGTVVTLGDCARVEGPAPAGVGRTVVAAAPPVGAQVILTAAQIGAVLAGLGYPGVQIAGAPACVVTTPAM